MPQGENYQWFKAKPNVLRYVYMEKPLSGLKDKEHLTTLLSEQQKKKQKSEYQMC